MLKRIPSLLAAILLLTVVSIGAIVNNPAKASAVTGSDWRAGRIIDDPIFTDKNAMSVGDIQNFLNQKVGTGGYDSVPGTPSLMLVVHARNTLPQRVGLPHSRV
jgi:hypothetical protein